MDKPIKIYSPYLDKNIQKDIMNSPIWKNCYHEDEEKPEHTRMICYHIKFDGTKPIQVTKIVE